MHNKISESPSWFIGLVFCLDHCSWAEKWNNSDAFDKGESELKYEE